MKFKKYIPNQQKELLKNQIKKAEDDLINSDLDSKDFLIALLNQMKKVV